MQESFATDAARETVSRLGGAELMPYGPAKMPFGRCSRWL
jgi:hypothetical protein